MALPKIDVPTFDLTLPSSGNTIKARPFLVKEEKLLLMASESKDVNEVINATTQVINNCIIDDDVNVEKLPFFDIDYLFIALRAKSIGENIEVQFTCNNVVDSELCNHIFPAIIDISNCVIVKDNDVDDIKVSGGKGVKLKYPTYRQMKIITNDEMSADKKIKLIASCIDYIYDKEQIYPAKDHTKEELIEFIESMTENNFKKLESFVDNLPSFAVHAEATCNKCNFEHKLRYTNFERFFT